METVISLFILYLTIIFQNLWALDAFTLYDEVKVGLTISTSPIKELQVESEARCFGVCTYHPKCFSFDHDALKENSNINCRFYDAVYTPDVSKQDPKITLHTTLVFKDCLEWLLNGFTKSGSYWISIQSKMVQVHCDGGWTYFQRRLNGDVSFQKNWEAYTNGFGDVNANYWLGNEYVRQLTSTGKHNLRMFGRRSNGEERILLLNEFSLGSASEQYVFRFQSANATDADLMNGAKFETTENGEHCANKFENGWWYHGCYFLNLNGKYTTDYTNIVPDYGICWIGFGGGLSESLMNTSMAIRRIVQ